MVYLTFIIIIAFESSILCLLVKPKHLLQELYCCFFNNVVLALLGPILKHRQLCQYFMPCGKGPPWNKVTLVLLDRSKKVLSCLYGKITKRYALFQ